MCAAYANSSEFDDVETWEVVEVIVLGDHRDLVAERGRGDPRVVERHATADRSQLCDKSRSETEESSSEERRYAHEHPAAGGELTADAYLGGTAEPTVRDLASGRPAAWRCP